MHSNAFEQDAMLQNLGTRSAYFPPTPPDAPGGTFANAVKLISHVLLGESP